MKYDVNPNFFEEYRHIYKVNNLIKNCIILIGVLLLTAFTLFYHTKKNNNREKSLINKFKNSPEYRVASQNIEEYKSIESELDFLLKKGYSSDNNELAGEIIDILGIDILNNLIINDNKINIKAHLPENVDYSIILSKIQTTDNFDKINSVSLRESGMLDVELIAENIDESKLLIEKSSNND